MLKYFTTGESHGQHMAAILEGMPSGVVIDYENIDNDLSRRQGGYGRGGRQKIEKDHVELIGGVLKGITTGAPVGFLLTNTDFKIDKMPELLRPRPGHADLAGSLKYHQGIRPVLERASARETVMRVAVGALCKIFLEEFGVRVVSHVVQIGAAELAEPTVLKADEIREKAASSQVYCVCPETEARMVDQVDQARRRKDTLGGKFEVRVSGLPIGLGSYVHFERKLDGRLAQILMSMQSIKAVEMGDGARLGGVFGSEAHDEIYYETKKGYYRKTNHAGGLEGGMTNGADLVVRATMKPISTLGQPLASVNMQTKQPEKADFERSDICAVPAGSVIGEALVAYTVCDAFLEKFGGDSVHEIKQNHAAYLKTLRG